MNKYIFLVLVLFSPFVQGAEPDKELHTKCIYPTIMLGKNDGSYGTGVVIRCEKDADEFYSVAAISCAHVTNNASPIRVHLFRYADWSTLKEVHIYDANVYFEDIQRDLSVVVFRTNQPIECGELNFSEKLYIGNEVSKVGIGGGDYPRCDFGKITDLGSTKRYIQSSCPTIPGDSGGPIFYNYKIVGITKTVHVFGTKDVAKDYFTSCSRAVPLSHLKKSIEENPKIKFLIDKKEAVPKYKKTGKP